MLVVFLFQEIDAYLNVNLSPVCLRPEVSSVEFSEPGVFNYSTLLLSEERGALYVGAREAVFQLDLKDVSVRRHQVRFSDLKEHYRLWCVCVCVM